MRTSRIIIPTPIDVARARGVTGSKDGYVAHIRMTHQERAKIERGAERLGITLSMLMRHTGLYTASVVNALPLENDSNIIPAAEIHHGMVEIFGVDDDGRYYRRELLPIRSD